MENNRSPQTSLQARAAVTLAFCVTSAAMARPASFEHPRVFPTKDSLQEFGEAGTSRPGDPRADAFAQMQRDPRAALGYKPQPYAHVPVKFSGATPKEEAFADDAVTACLHALQWVATKDSAHFEKIDKHSRSLVCGVGGWR